MTDGALPLLSEALEALRGADNFEPEELETGWGGSSPSTTSSRESSISRSGSRYGDVGIARHLRIACSPGQEIAP